jgi:hypothetical protein
LEFSGEEKDKKKKKKPYRQQTAPPPPTQATLTRKERDGASNYNMEGYFWLSGGATRSACVSNAPSLQHLFYLNNNKLFLKNQITLDELSNNKKKSEKIKRPRHAWFNIFD